MDFQFNDKVRDLQDWLTRFMQAHVDRLTGRKPPQPLVEFMESLHLDGLDLARESDRGRDVEL